MRIRCKSIFSNLRFPSDFKRGILIEFSMYVAMYEGAFFNSLLDCLDPICSHSQTFSLAPLGLSMVISTSPRPALNVSTVNLAGAPTLLPLGSIPGEYEVQ